MSELLAERQAAHRLLPFLLPQHDGKSAVFHGEGLVAIFDDVEEAMKFAYSKYRPGEFLIMEMENDSEEEG